MDDVVGTGPGANLMSDFKHMKTSLHLMDVVVLRNEGDTVNFWGLEITEASRGVEVTDGSTELVESLLKFYGLENKKPTANPGGRQHSDGACDSNSFGWSRLLQLSHSRRKISVHGTLETRHAIDHSTTVHTSP